MAGIDAVNSFHSVFCFSEKAVVMVGSNCVRVRNRFMTPDPVAGQAELHRLNRELGDDVFPVMSQSYFASYREMMYSQSFPAVVKVGTAHAGMGKMIIRVIALRASCHARASPTACTFVGPSRHGGLSIGSNSEPELPLVMTPSLLPPPPSSPSRRFWQ
jgi:hypothetical protein